MTTMRPFFYASRPQLAGGRYAGVTLHVMAEGRDGYCGYRMWSTRNGEIINRLGSGFGPMTRDEAIAEAKEKLALENTPEWSDRMAEELRGRTYATPYCRWIEATEEDIAFMPHSFIGNHKDSHKMKEAKAHLSWLQSAKAEWLAEHELEAA